MRDHGGPKLFGNAACAIGTPRIDHEDLGSPPCDALQTGGQIALFVQRQDNDRQRDAGFHRSTFLMPPVLRTAPHDHELCDFKGTRKWSLVRSFRATRVEYNPSNASAIAVHVNRAPSVRAAWLRRRRASRELMASNKLHLKAA